MKPTYLDQVLKAGYRISPLRPTAIAATCAAMLDRRITVIPVLVKDGAFTRAAAFLDAQLVPAEGRMLKPDGWRP